MKNWAVPFRLKGRYWGASMFQSGDDPQAAKAATTATLNQLAAELGVPPERFQTGTPQEIKEGT